MQYGFCTVKLLHGKAALRGSLRQDLSVNVIDKAAIMLYNTTTNGAVKVSTGVLKPAKHVEFA